MRDTMEIIGSSLVQHGPRRDGAYLMKLHPTDALDIVDRLERLAISQSYSKVCAKVPAREAGQFVAAGFRLEAAMPNFFPGGEAACFLVKYYRPDRRPERRPLLVREVLIAAGAQHRVGTVPLPAGFAARMAREKDAVKMAALYREVLATCPFPILEPALFRAAMNEGTLYFSIWKGRRLVALSCADIDISSSSAELTHFAILPEYCCHGLTLHLLQQMEEKLLALGIRSLSTTARAYSFGMNITFARNGYHFGGTLTNSTNIHGSLESMNVWHKSLQDDPRFAWKSLFD